MSSLQSAVSHAISALQAAPGAQVARYELESATALTSVDILVKCHGRAVAVEVDGPVHYAANKCALTAAMMVQHVHAKRSSFTAARMVGC